MWYYVCLGFCVFTARISRGLPQKEALYIIIGHMQPGNSAPGLANRGGADGVKYRNTRHVVWWDTVWVFSGHFLPTIVIHPENCSGQEKYYYLIATGCGRDERSKKPRGDQQTEPGWYHRLTLVWDVRTKENNCIEVKTRRTWQYTLPCVVCMWRWCNKVGIYGC